MIAAVRRWPRSQQVTRLVVLLGPLVALAAAAPAGNAPTPAVGALAVLLSLGWAALPESLLGTLDLVLVLLWWTRVPDDALHPTALVAAVAVVAAHVAALLAGAAPPRTPVDREVVRLWVRRGATVLLAAPVLWVLARLLRDEPGPDLLWPAALLAVTLVVVSLSPAVQHPEET